MKSLPTEIVWQMARPVRAFLKRWGTSSMKQFAWKHDFQRGINIHNVEIGYRSAICDWVEKYALCGDVLDLGCSDGHVGHGLNLLAYSTYTGVDISNLAICAARVKLDCHDADRRAKIRFVQGDIATYHPVMRPSVVLFKDSIYYLNKADLINAIDHYRGCMSSDGVFIVQMDNVKRHGWIRELIIGKCEIIEDLVCEDLDYMIIVFR